MQIGTRPIAPYDFTNPSGVQGPQSVGGSVPTIGASNPLFVAGLLKTLLDSTKHDVGPDGKPVPSQEEEQWKRREDLLKTKQKLELQAYQMQNPKPKTGINKGQGWTLMAAGLLQSLLDPKGQTQGALTSGIAQGMQTGINTENQQAQAEADRQRQLLLLRAQQLGENAGLAGEKASMLAKERMDRVNQQQALEIEKARAGNREDLKQIDIDLRTVPDVTKDGPARAAAARRLVASGRAAYTPEYIAGLEQVPAVSVQQLEQKKKMDRFEMDRRTSLLDLATRAADDKHAMSDLRLEMTKEENKYLPAALATKQLQAKANLRKTLKSIEESAARIDKLKTAAKVGPGGRPMTATSLATQIGTALGQLGKAERELAQAESTQAYWESQAEGLARDEGFKIYDSKGNAYQGNAAKAIVDRMLQSSKAESAGYRAEIGRYKERMENAKSIFGQGQAKATLPPGVKIIK